MDFEQQLELRAVIAGVVREVLETGAGGLRLAGGAWIGRVDQETAPGELALTGRIWGSTATACRVWHSAAQSLPNSAWSQVVFDTALFDGGGLYRAGAPGELVAPCAGVYLAGATLGFEGRAAGQRLMTIVTNGGAVWHTNASQPGGAGGDIYLEAHALVKLNEGDRLHVWAYQDSGSALGLLSVREAFPVLWAARLA